jgi:hypothetical protein
VIEQLDELGPGPGSSAPGPRLVRIRAVKNGEHRVRIDKTQLAMILGGVRLESAQRRKRYQRVLT